MLSDRKKVVLKAIIDEFIESALPVGSKLLIQKYEIPYSSATIRNEMVTLEKLGFLEKTHTSSGRVPSEEGYRFYIENLMDGKQSKKENVSSREVSIMGANQGEFTLLDALANICYKSGISFDERIREIIKLLSDITNHTVFYLGPSLQRVNVSQIKLLQVSSYEAVVLLITDQGKVETRLFAIHSLQELETLDYIVKYLNEMLTHIPLSQIVEKLETEIKPILGKHLQEYALFHKEFLLLFESFVASTIYFSGQVNMITDESLNDFRNLKAIFNFFEDEKDMLWFKSSELGIDVHIGEELKNEIFNNYALIRMTFEMPITRGHGTIGIIGPKRMQYNETIQLLNFVQQFIGSRLKR
ncbi:heat-inducible transcription repressor HrcA [Erysipelotrichaceae bacterium]|nr:heat-inducible transcription repressor HrcA [Erysipelotrichaceae bacterium]